MRRIVRGVLVALLGAGIAGCGGGGEPAGHALAAQACRTGGSQAADLAQRAAAANSTYATLAADETALAASEAQQQQELSDSTGAAGGQGLGGLTGATALGTPGSIKVLTDCTTLGLPVTN